jgi:glyoxylase-like metal-dependent hydrolase (beta-lactamase superfamily II)
MSTRFRVLVGIAGVLGIALLAVVALVAWTFSGMGAVVDGEQLPGGGTVVRDGYVSFVVLEAEPGKVALVDAGNDLDGAVVLAELARRGLGPADVTTILLTHGHPDHVAGCALFPDATTYAHRDELPLLRGEVAAQGPITRMVSPKPSGCANLVGLGDGDEVPIGLRPAKLFAVPGHTAGSAAWLHAGVLYLGDSADAASDGKLLPAKWVFTDSTERNEQALRDLAKALAATPVERLVFSHSGTLEGTALRMWASTR